MLGDARSEHFMVALQSIAAKQDWQVVTYFRSARPSLTGPTGPSGRGG
jgi:hypothetical protein